MLITDNRAIGNKLLTIRKSMGLTQAQVAEAAELSDRAYADIERGTSNMRLHTILHICAALHITPNEILTDDDTPLDIEQEELFTRLALLPSKERATALELLAVYLDSLK